MSAWVAARQPKPEARVRLFCFPHGGGGASLFRTWQEQLPATIDVCPVQLPGREERLREPPFEDLAVLVPELADALEPHLTLPCALFGHSVGAFVAFELARHLREWGPDEPVHLIVSGQRPPQAPPAFAPVYDLPDADFIAEVQRRYDAIPPVVLASPDLMRAFLRLLRADFAMVDTYAYIEGEPLECPITCLGAREDPESLEDDLQGWRDHTRRTCRVRMFSGGHFFIETARDAVLQAIVAALGPTTHAAR